MLVLTRKPGQAIQIDLMEGLDFQPRSRPKTRRPPQQKVQPDA